MTIKIKSCSMPPGELKYRMAEVHDSVPVIFIHGAAGDSRQFQFQLEYFKGKRTVVAIDLPGHGKSVIETLPVMADYVAAVAAVLEAEKMDRCVLAGHSMGGGIIMEAYRSFPEKIAGLVFLSTGAKLPVSDLVFDFLDKDYRVFCEFLVKLSYSKALPEEVRQMVLREARSLDPVRVKNDFRICASFDYTDMLREVGVPSMVLACTGDKMVPHDVSRALAAGLPGARLEVLEGEGHLPYFERHQEVNGLIAEFIEGLNA
ncbi:MAG: alpha/beta hydrolase [Spirochaetes bacterium]|jgi:pimeloyl-ACP methyl ester carboxylesterase|nr:alpha/beta hydrolase [Spirochaetota bacterium]